MVEHLPSHLKVKGSSPGTAADARREKKALKYIFLISETCLNISFVAIDYRSVPLTLFICYMNGISLREQDEIEW
jgi:hypothetical protein